MQRAQPRWPPKTLATDEWWRNHPLTTDLGSRDDAQSLVEKTATPDKNLGGDSPREPLAAGAVRLACAEPKAVAHESNKCSGGPAVFLHRSGQHRTKPKPAQARAYHQHRPAERPLQRQVQAVHPG